MTFSNKFVMAVFIDGQPTKELTNGVVPIKFGQEYSLRFRNKNNRKAVVKIYIDGENVSGGGYVVPANDYVDIKRHWDKDRSFKFVSLDSAEAVEFGKNGPNPDKVKGTIEAHFYLEKEHSPPAVEHHHHHHHYPPIYTPPPVNPWPWKPYQPYRPLWCNTDNPASYGTDNIRLSDADSTANYSGGDIKFINKNDSKFFNRLESLNNRKTTAKSDCLPCSHNISLESLNEATPLQDGCTVEGYTTGQQFSTTWVDLEETYTTLKVFLQGFESDHVHNLEETPKKCHKTNKKARIDDLEAENEDLRKQLAEIENEKLKKKLKKVKKKKETLFEEPPYMG